MRKNFWRANGKKGKEGKEGKRKAKGDPSDDETVPTVRLY